MHFKSILPSKPSVAISPFRISNQNSVCICRVIHACYISPLISSSSVYHSIFLIKCRKYEASRLAVFSSLVFGVNILLRCCWLITQTHTLFWTGTLLATLNTCHVVLVSESERGNKYVRMHKKRLMSRPKLKLNNKWKLARKGTRRKPKLYSLKINFHW
jgi:hypothetical protein